VIGEHESTARMGKAWLLGDPRRLMLATDIRRTKQSGRRSTFGANSARQRSIHASHLGQKPAVGAGRTSRAIRPATQIPITTPASAFTTSNELSTN